MATACRIIPSAAKESLETDLKQPDQLTVGAETALKQSGAAETILTSERSAAAESASVQATSFAAAALSNASSPESRLCFSTDADGELDLRSSGPPPRVNHLSGVSAEERDSQRVDTGRSLNDSVDSQPSPSATLLPSEGLKL